jgi:hypothetical protein
VICTVNSLTPNNSLTFDGIPIAVVCLRFYHAEPPSRFASFASCSTICLLQLRRCQLANASLTSHVGNDSLSTGIEASLLGHPRPLFQVCAYVECDGSDAEDDGAHDQGVGLPVCGLRVPSTGRRPDVCRIPGGLQLACCTKYAVMRRGFLAYAILPWPPRPGV